MRNQPCDGRWICAVESDDREFWRDETGALRTGANFVLHPDAIPLYTEGRVCIQCHQDQKEAMPKVCWVCGFPIRRRQLERYKQSFRGEHRLGSLADEEREDEEFAERVEQMRSQRMRGSRIWVPKGVSRQ